MRGGMDVHGKLIAQGLAARGHRVVFISTSHPSGKAREEIDGVEIHYLKNTVFGSRRSGWAEESVHALEVMHKQHPFDLIWSQSYDGFGVTRNSGTVGQIPMLATLHGSIQQEYTSFLANIGRGWKRPMYPLKAFSGLFYSYFITQKPVLRHSRGIVTVSRRVVEDLGKWFGRSSPANAKRFTTASISNGSVQTRRAGVSSGAITPFRRMKRFSSPWDGLPVKRGIIS